MSGPITWRSLTGNQPADAIQPLLASQQSFGGAFDALARVLQGFNDGSASQAAGIRETNKQNFLDALSGAKTPEQLAALQSSGQLAALQAKLTPDARVAVRGAEDARLAGVRQQVLADQAYKDQQTVYGQRDREGDILFDMARGNHKAARATLLESPELVNRAKLFSLLTEAEAAATDSKHKALKRDWEIEDRPGVVADRETARAVANLQLEGLKDSRAREAEQRAAAAVQAQAQAELDFMKSRGNRYTEELYTPEKAPAVRQLMEDIGMSADEGERSKIIARLGKLSAGIAVDVRGEDGKMQKGKTLMPLPMSLVKEKLLSIKDSKINWWDEGWADQLEKAIRKSALETIDAPFMVGTDGIPVTLQQNRLAFDHNEYFRNRVRKAESPVVGGGKGK